MAKYNVHFAHEHETDCFEVEANGLDEAAVEGRILMDARLARYGNFDRFLLVHVEPISSGVISIDEADEELTGHLEWVAALRAREDAFGISNRHSHY